MSLEGFSKRGMELGSNSEQIKETSNDLRQQYLNSIKKLALQKMKNDLLFEGSLGVAMRSLSSLGLDVSKESMLKDIEYEVNKQRMNFDIEMPNISIEEHNINIENQSEIEQLKNNLGNIFQSIPKKSNQPINRESSIQGLESTNKKQNFDDVYEFELKKLTELKKSRNPNYEVELNNAIAKISSLTDRIPNIREQIESDISYEMRNTNQNQQQEVVSTPTLNQEEFEKVLQEQQKQMKDKIIDQLMGAMNRSGEFSFGDISMSERMSIMQNVQNKLNDKSMDELQMILATYQEQNVQEETMSSKMHR